MFIFVSSFIHFTADSDSDIDKDSVSPSASCSMTSESITSSSLSKIRNDSLGSSEEEPTLQNRSSRKNSRGRGGRAKRFPQSMAELMKRQEDANEKHNHNERIRLIVCYITSID